QQDPSQWMPAADSVAMNAPQAVEKPNRKPDPQPRRKQRTRRFPNLSHLQLGHVDELFSHGVLLMGREEYEDAATIFTEVLKHDPSDGEAHQHRGEARLAMGDFSGAVSDCEAALAADDGDLAALLIHAEASLHLGDDATAAKMVKRAFREDRENAEASLLQGKIAARAGDYRQAIQAFRAALSRDAFLADAHLWLADCLDNTNASEQAAIHRQRAYHLDPGLESDRPAF
ncbi:MAG: tetratricopeptide repeat protein, partial [Planctomycetota bacterium]